MPEIFKRFTHTQRERERDEQITFSAGSLTICERLLVIILKRQNKHNKCLNRISVTFNNNYKIIETMGSIYWTGTGFLTPYCYLIV